ncbi:hypothetical protein VTK56DRAFT_1061 [Thermocarpiscus australiensis]
MGISATVTTTTNSNTSTTGAIAAVATSTTTSPSAATASFASQRNDSTGLIIDCPFPGCSVKIDGKREVLCETHLQAVSNPDRSRDAPSLPANDAHIAPVSTESSSSAPSRQPPMRTSNLKKLLPDNGPIMRRKSAQQGPQFTPQQPTPKHTTPPSCVESSVSPLSPPPVAPQPSVHSPPLSPRPVRDGEPARKRQKLSPSPGQSPKPLLNGRGASTSRPSTAETNLGNKPAKSESPRSDRRTPNQISPQRPGKPVEKEGKTGVKQSSRHPVRRLPLQLSNLRFIDDPGDHASRILPDQSRSEVNSDAGSAPRQSHGGAKFSLNEGIKDYWTGKMNNSVSSVARTEATADSPSRIVTLRIPGLLNGHGRKPLPDEAGTQAASRGTHRSVTPKALPQTIPFPVRRVQSARASKPPPYQPPKQKIVDPSSFDALIYSQPGASTPPPEVDIPPPAPPTTKPKPSPASAITDANAIAIANGKDQSAPQDEEDEPLYADIDPRVHWPQHHSPAWHAAKQAEIRARGKKKANFGRAAHSLRQQRLRERGVSFEDSLPEKIVENPAWVRALRRLKGVVEDEVGGNGGGGNGEAGGGGGGAGAGAGGGQKRGRGRMGVKRAGSGSGSASGSGLGGSGLGTVKG